MNSLGTILAALALAGVGLVYVKVDRLADRVELDGARADADRSVRADGPDTGYAGTPIARPSRSVGADAGPSGGAAEPAAANAAPTTLDDRVARLERELAAARARPNLPFARPFRARRVARSVDDLASRLDLTAAQKDRVQDAVTRGKRRIEDILRIPDETGTSPFERRAQRRQKIEEALKKRSREPGALVPLAMGALNDRNKKIPGRDATYGDEIDRVKNETRDEIVSQLDTGQREAFADTAIDPLLGETSSSGGFQVFVGSGDGPESAVGIAIESDDGGTDVEIVAEASPGSGTDEEKE